MLSTEEEIKAIAESYLAGGSVIATARALHPYWHVSSINPAIQQLLVTFVGINDETNALPLGKLREMWHPSTAGLEDEKIAKAEDFYRERATEACR